MSDTPHLHHPMPVAAQEPPMMRYSPDTQVDFVIVGSGSAGGIMARELSRAGFSVVVLEQGPWLKTSDMKHDELWIGPEFGLTNNPKHQPATFRMTEAETAKPRPWMQYGRVVGGGSVHFSANFWRFPEIEFHQASKLGVPDGSTIADWPFKFVSDIRGIEDINPYFSDFRYDIQDSALNFRGYGYESIFQFLRDCHDLKNGKFEAADLKGLRATFQNVKVSTAVVEAVNSSLENSGEWVHIDLDSLMINTNNKGS